MLTTVNGTQSGFIGLIQQVPVTIGNVSILTTFVIVEEMSYKIILSKPQVVQAQLITKQTAIGQVSCIIRSKDGLAKIRFLAVYNNANFIKNNKVLECEETLGNGQPERPPGLCLELRIAQYCNRDKNKITGLGITEKY